MISQVIRKLSIVTTLALAGAAIASPTAQGDRNAEARAAGMPAGAAQRAVRAAQDDLQYMIRLHQIDAGSLTVRGSLPPADLSCCNAQQDAK